MAELHFAKPCTFTDESGETRVFAQGRHKDVPDAIAGHWFVLAHLVKDGDEPAVADTAPLQHEERRQVKASIDAAEGRAKGAEAERDAALARAEKAEADLAAERQAHDETKRLLDEATAPNGQTPLSGEYAVKRGHQGKFKVVKGDEVVADGLAKADAEARADELNARA